MNSKKWIKILLILCFSGIGFVGGVNYLVDPSQIFHKQVSSYKGLSNGHYLKIEYLLQNHSKYNSYMMSSSRGGTTNPFIIDKYIKNAKFYNMYLGYGNISDNINHLNYLIKQKIKIDNLYLQLDINNLEDIKFSENTHPDVLNTSKYKYIISMIFNPNFMNIYKKITEVETLAYHKLDIQTGIFNYIIRDKLIKEDHEKYVELEKTFHSNTVRNKKFITKKEFIKKLKNLNNIVKENNINLILFITPHHHKFMSNYETNSYLEYIKTISEHNNFYNFSGYNSITLNDFNYYESSHILPKVGDLIAARIFDDQNIDIPKDFGVLVTKENIDEHLSDLKQQIKEYDLAKVK